MGTDTQRAIATRLAAQTWGSIQQQRKLTTGIWMFSTSGHGGIVIDSDMHPRILMVKPVSQVLIRAGSQWMRPGEQHFVALEEDCDAAIAEWLYADEILTPRYMSHFSVENGIDFQAWKEARIRMLKDCLKQWNSEVLVTFPLPNAGVNDKKEFV